MTRPNLFVGRVGVWAIVHVRSPIVIIKKKFPLYYFVGDDDDDDDDETAESL